MNAIADMLNHGFWLQILFLHGAVWTDRDHRRHSLAGEFHDSRELRFRNLMTCTSVRSKLLGACKALSAFARQAFPILRSAVMLVDVDSPWMSCRIQDADFVATSEWACVWGQVFREVFSEA